MISDLINDFATASSDATTGSTAFDGATNLFGTILGLVEGFFAEAIGS